MQWWHWWCCHQCSSITSHHQHQCQWHHVMPVLMSVASHERKGHIASYMNCVHLRNAMLSLIMLFASFVTGTSISGMKWPNIMFLSFWKLDVRKAFGFFLMPLASHDQRSYVAHSFNHFDLVNTMYFYFRMSLASHDANACTNSV